MSKNRKMRFAIVAAAGLSALFAPRLAGAVHAKILDFTYGGNGCPGDSINFDYDPVNNELTLRFNQFTTKLPPGLSTACNLSFVVQAPFNAKVSLSRVEYVGYINIDPGVTAELIRNYKYGLNPPLTKTDTFPGPQSGSWSMVDRALGASSCTRTVTVLANTRIHLAGTPEPDHVNEFVIDDLRFRGKVMFKLNFEPC